jgi:hypothetical protein
MKRLLLFLFATSCWAQVYTTTVTAGGSGYTSAPTVTASGGSCTTEPTFTATTASNAVTALTVTYAGAGCTTAPTLAFSGGGGGTGAAATTALLPYTQVILASIPSCSSQGIQPCVGGAFTAFQYECDLVVPQQRVKYYGSTASASTFTMPGTSQSSQFQPASTIPAPIVTDLTNGVLTVYSSTLSVTTGTLVSVVETQINSLCATAQTNLNSWNPWVNYSTFYNPLTATWTALGAQ